MKIIKNCLYFLLGLFLVINSTSAEYANEFSSSNYYDEDDYYSEEYEEDEALEDSEDEEVKNFYYSKNNKIGLKKEPLAIAEAIIKNISFSQKISIRSSKQAIKLKLMNLLNNSNSQRKEILLGVLNVMGLHSVNNNANFIKVLYRSNAKDSGYYDPNSDKIVINLDVSSKEFYHTMIHEMTHKLMYHIFSSGKPYKQNDRQAKAAFLKAVQSINKSIDLISDLDEVSASVKQTVLTWENVRESYNESEYNDEYIAHFAELFVLDLDADAKKLLEPMTNYWMQYIKPQIERYVSAYN